MFGVNVFYRDISDLIEVASTGVEGSEGEGTLVLTGFTASATVGGVPTGGTLSYTYTLKAPLSQPGAGESTDAIALQVVDAAGITSAGTLTVRIVDDVPQAQPDTNSVTEDAAQDTATGNVVSAGAGIDRLGAVLLDFPGVAASFTYGTQLVPRQTMQFFGDKGRLVVEVPFNAPNDVPCRLSLFEGPGLGDVAVETIEIPACDQYGVMGDAFAAAVQDGTPQPVPLENSLANMKVIDAVFRAAANGSWERP